MDRSNPYEAAFEGYLKAQGLCYVGIDEGRRTRLGRAAGQGSTSSSSALRRFAAARRRQGSAFPGGPPRSRATRGRTGRRRRTSRAAELDEVFGPGYLALFLFLYRIGPTVELPADTWTCGPSASNNISLRAVALDDTCAHEGAQPEVGDGQLARGGLSEAGPAVPLLHARARPEEPHGPRPLASLRESLESALAVLAPGGGRKLEAAGLELRGRRAGPAQFTQPAAARSARSSAPSASKRGALACPLRHWLDVAENQEARIDTSARR